MLAFLGECAPVSPFLPNDFVRNLRDADVDVEKVRKIGFLSARERTIERGNKRLKDAEPREPNDGLRARQASHQWQAVKPSTRVRL